MCDLANAIASRNYSVSTESANSPKSTKSRYSDFSVSCGTNSNRNVCLIWICTKQFELVNLVDCGGVAFSVETVKVQSARCDGKVTHILKCQLAATYHFKKWFESWWFFWHSSQLSLCQKNAYTVKATNCVQKMTTELVMIDHHSHSRHTHTHTHTATCCVEQMRDMYCVNNWESQ